MFAVAQAAEQALTSPHWLPTGNEGPNSGAAAAPPARLMLARARISAAWSSTSPLLPVPSSCSAAAMQVAREAVEGLMRCSAWARLGPGRAPSRPLLREESMALRAMHACKVLWCWGKIGQVGMVWALCDFACGSRRMAVELYSARCRCYLALASAHGDAAPVRSSRTVLLASISAFFLRQ